MCSVYSVEKKLAVLLKIEYVPTVALNTVGALFFLFFYWLRKNYMGKNENGQ